jgi:hypothetical protein
MIGIHISTESMKKQPFRLFRRLFIFVAIVYLTAYWMTDYLTQPSSVWTTAQLSGAISQDQVKLLWIYSDNKAIAETKEGRRLLIVTERETSLLAHHQSLGISSAKLSQIKIIVVPSINHRLLAWFGALLGGVPLVFLLLKTPRVKKIRKLALTSH